MSNPTEFVIDRSMDSILESLPVGSVQRAIGNNLYGINFNQTGNAVPRAKDAQGFVFFTRPQLNMSSRNLTNYRGFYNLLTQNQVSYQRYTRLMLDPRLGYGPNGLTSSLVDAQNAFTPILTNNVMSLSGWPDLSVPTYTTETGIYGQEASYVDGITNHWEAYDLDVTFKNTRGNPLIYMFYIWIKYQALVFEGILNPYLDMIVENEIDYNTRIYRIVLDQQKRYVHHIACTGASFPVNVPSGNLFDYSVESPFNTRNAELNIRFRCSGFVAFEDIVKYWFNQASCIFNPGLRKVLQHDLSQSGGNVYRENPGYVYTVSGSGMVKVPYLIASMADSYGIENRYLSVNHKAIPYINLSTNELEWWAQEKYFNHDTNQLDT